MNERWVNVAIAAAFISGAGFGVFIGTKLADDPPEPTPVTVTVDTPDTTEPFCDRIVVGC